MSTVLNHPGLAKAHSLIADGKINNGAWSFSADDGNKLLGPNGDDWSSYSQWFLGLHSDQTPQTKGYYGYPFGKDGEVYRAALAAIASRASAAGATDISKAASAMIDTIDAKAKGIKKLDGVQRAYARLDVKGLTEDENYYYIDGIASTPTPDRSDDIVDPMGAKFALPLPLLWQHNSMMPIGNVVKSKPTKAGIPMTAAIPKVKEAGVLQDRINEAIQSVKYKLVTGLSIGFKTLNNAFEFLENGGVLFKEWEWLELSMVTIPANSEASITNIKAFDELARKHPLPSVVRVPLLNTEPVPKPGVFRLQQSS